MNKMEQVDRWKANLVFEGRTEVVFDTEKAYVRCPQCKKKFNLKWKDWDDEYIDQKPTIAIYSCPSGGVYNVKLRCSYCDYEEEL